jgi:hypothetical protein
LKSLHHVFFGHHCVGSFLSIDHNLLVLPHRLKDRSVECGSDGGGIRSQEPIDLIRFHEHCPSLMWATMDYEWMDVADFHLLHELGIRAEGGLVVWVAR